MIWTQHGKYLLFPIYEPFRIKKGKCSGLYLTNQYISKMIFIPLPLKSSKYENWNIFPPKFWVSMRPLPG